VRMLRVPLRISVVCCRNWVQPRAGLEVYLILPCALPLSLCRSGPLNRFNLVATLTFSNSAGQRPTPPPSPSVIWHKVMPTWDVRLQEGILRITVGREAFWKRRRSQGMSGSQRGGEDRAGHSK
jgi:hypothetical protein